MTASTRLRTAGMILLWLVGALLLLLFLFNFEVYRDWSFICRNTGSQYGYRDWFFGCRTGEWSEPSALETYMQKHHPSELRLKWKCRSGSGRNIFGAGTGAASGAAGPIVTLSPAALAEYVDRSDDEQVRALYALFSSEDDAAIYAQIKKMTQQQSPGGR
jgi:hypothetical protein